MRATPAILAGTTVISTVDGKRGAAARHVGADRRKRSRQERVARQIGRMVVDRAGQLAGVKIGDAIACQLEAGRDLLGDEMPSVLARGHVDRQRRRYGAGEVPAARVLRECVVAARTDVAKIARTPSTIAAGGSQPPA